ncbi:uncharacterized protein LOC136083080 [Hydra vulgaris]|uniref:Uncharacterized protein LOC136083080 n=1 Tax=Hydra vulgaris TaxID=6087 RepID=A0ABM4CA74_HYDVU
MYLNATSLENKFDEFKVLVDTYRPQIIAVSETWFKSISVVNLNGYNLYRRDRNDGRRGGGVCLYITETIKSLELNDAVFNLSKIEQIWATAYLENNKYLVGCIYRPNDFVDMSDLDLVFKKTKDYIDIKGYKDLLITGDFNFPSIVWSNGYITNIKNENGIEHNFSDTLTRTYLYQHVNVPTFQISNNSATNTLDLIFTTQSGSICAIDPSSVLGNINKGHLVIFFDFIIKSMVNTLSHSYLKFNYKKGNTNKISDFITNIDWVMMFETLSVQEMYDNLIHFSNVSCNQFIPVLDVARIKKQIAPWIKNDLKTLIKKKQNLRYLNCACKWRDLTLSKEYKLTCKLVKKEIKIARLAYENVLVKRSKTNPKLLYKYLNSQQLIKESIRALKTTNGDLTQEPREIANLLNKCFQDVFVIEEEGELPHFTVEFNENHSKFVDLETNDISYEMILDKLKNLNQNKACGPDNMHPFLLKNCAEAFAIPLTLIIRASLTNSQLPVQFKSANVTPLFKKGDKTLPSNYRPVSLTSIPCKIMETFDTVPHKRLLAKLKAYSFDGLILKWIKAFLENRRQRVVQGEIISDWVNIFSGVPQGSVIAALLFALYINDLPKKLHNVTKLYADETKVLSQLSSEQCATNLQNDLDIVYKWSQTWLLLFNIPKCVVMHYGYNNKKYLYNLNSIQLKESDTERDLGVLFNANLKWKNQVMNASNKANQMLACIKKSFVCFDYKLLRLLYVTFIRPLLEFAVPVWSPYYKSDCDYIEKIQHKATKLVSSIRNLSYTKRLEKLNLTTLVERRQRGDPIQMYKIMNNIDILEKCNRFPIVNNHTRGHCFKYFKEMTKHKHRENFFFNRVANVWNSLPEEVVKSPSVNSFKAAIDCWMSSNRSIRLSKCA